VIDGMYAILLISDDAKALAEFYREALGLPLEDEVHDGAPLHYGCEVGGVHFAIHPAPGWPGRATPDSQSPVLIFHTDDVEGAYQRLRTAGVGATPPFDHGLAVGTSFRDPDGNNVQVMSATS
jgi:catechol 2,3-dioxygenase-like lactoylglutathione lyase family enzyme